MHRDVVESSIIHDSTNAANSSSTAIQKCAAPAVAALSLAGRYSVYLL